MKKKALAIVLAASMLMMTACSTAKETTESSCVAELMRRYQALTSIK